MRWRLFLCSYFRMLSFWCAPFTAVFVFSATISGVLCAPLPLCFVFVHIFQFIVVLVHTFCDTMASVLCACFSPVSFLYAPLPLGFVVVPAFQVGAVFVYICLGITFVFVRILQVVVVFVHIFSAGFGFCARISYHCRFCAQSFRVVFLFCTFHTIVVFVQTFYDDLCFCPSISGDDRFCGPLLRWLLFLCVYFKGLSFLCTPLKMISICLCTHFR